MTSGGISIQTFLDEWVATRVKGAKRKTPSYSGARPARSIKLRPAGFPFKEPQRGFHLNINDDKLFQSYAQDQWVGATIEKGEYLFDQRMIPDFAFEVVKVIPACQVTITEKTIITLEKVEIQHEFPGIKEYNFKDIIGHAAMKQKCKIVMKYLKNPSQFGGWAPRNFLFYGPPGTGKTMAAKALANETDSFLLLIRATDLIGEYVGDSSKRIHELFSLALEHVPSVIFIDELDAIGLDRSFQAIRGDVLEVVNALLTELEGLRDNDGLVTIAATNNPLMLDHALRSRFEEEIEFKLPNPEERLDILRSYARKLPMKVKTDLREYVKKTEGFSGRDLKDKLLKVALHKAIIEDSKIITQEHLDAALKGVPTRPKPPKEMFG
ncbi:MAG: AAA family ATPase [Candidatus Hydrothermarchaeales archaeon]